MTQCDVAVVAMNAVADHVGPMALMDRVEAWTE
jgi:hypothetical protein